MRHDLPHTDGVRCLIRSHNWEAIITQPPDSSELLATTHARTKYRGSRDRLRDERCQHIAPVSKRDQSQIPAVIAWHRPTTELPGNPGTFRLPLGDPELVKTLQVTPEPGGRAEEVGAVPFFEYPEDVQADRYQRPEPALLLANFLFYTT